jgi:hypothetical protein
MAEGGETEHVSDLDERIDNLARAVKDYLREGDSFLVQCQEDEILVEESEQSRFQKEHPRVYGRLLSLNDQLETGCGVTLVLFALGGLFCLSLQLGWWDDLLTVNVTDKLRTWWFYVPFFAGLFFLSDYFYTWLERRTYRRGRTELMALLRDEGLDRDRLVATIEDMPEFDKICKQLKRDPGPFGET